MHNTRPTRPILGLILGGTLSVLSFTLGGCGGGGGHATGGAAGQITGTVTRVILPSNGQGSSVRLPDTDTDVEIYQNLVLIKKARTDSQGRFTLSVPAGHYRVKPSDAILERTPAEIGSQEVDVTPGKTNSVALEITIPSV